MKNTKKCPLCEKGDLQKVWGNHLGRTIFFFIVFRPIRIIMIIIGIVDKKYKCNLCGKKFKTYVIDKE